MHCIFVRDNLSFLTTVRDYLKPGGKLLIVEYDTDLRNPFVPYPVSFEMLIGIMQAARALRRPELLARVPSRYWKQIYSAVARTPAGHGQTFESRTGAEYTVAAEIAQHGSEMPG